jgi:hypothetical protein
MDKKRLLLQTVSLLAALSIIVVIFAVAIKNNIRKTTETIVKADDNQPATHSPKPIDTSSWTEYSNDDLGFSIKIPAEVYGINMGGCIGGSSFKAPLKTLQDGDNVYIFPEYYYDVGDRGYCRKVEYTADLIKKEAAETSQTTGLPPDKLDFGWRIAVKTASADDIAGYAKETFGSSCVVDQSSLQDDGNYRIILKGTDWSSEDGYRNCNLDFAYWILYSPAKHKLMSVVLGQECNFYSADPVTDSSDYQCYDDDMFGSFKFE